MEGVKEGDGEGEGGRGEGGEVLSYRSGTLDVTFGRSATSPNYGADLSLHNVIKIN